MAMKPLLGGMATLLFIPIYLEEDHMVNFFKNWYLAKHSEQGQDLAEYALLIGLIALLVIVAVTLLGEQVSSIFSALATNISAWPATYGW